MTRVTLGVNPRIVAHYALTGESFRYVVMHGSDPIEYHVVEDRDLDSDLATSYWKGGAVGHDMNRDEEALQEVFHNLKTYNTGLQISWVAQPLIQQREQSLGDAVQFYVPDTEYKLTTWRSTLGELLEQSMANPPRDSLWLESEDDIDDFVRVVREIYPDPDAVGSYLGRNSSMQFTKLQKPVKLVFLSHLLKLLPSEVSKLSWNQEVTEGDRGARHHTVFQQIRQKYAKQIIRNSPVPLCGFSEAGYSEEVKLLLAQLTTDVNNVDKNGRTPLSLAAENGHIAIVQMLLGKDGVDLNLKDKLGMNPLAWAAVKGLKTVVKLLMDKEAVDLDSKTNRGMTPLSLAARNGHTEVVRLLMDKERVNPNSITNRGMTPLSLAARNGHKEVVRLLMGKKSIDVNSQDKNGWTPLLWAVRSGCCGMVKLLLNKEGVDPNIKDKGWWTLVQVATEMGHKGVVRLLKSREAATATTEGGERGKP